MNRGADPGLDPEPTDVVAGSVTAVRGGIRPGHNQRAPTLEDRLQRFGVVSDPDTTSVLQRSRTGYNGSG